MVDIQSTRPSFWRGAQAQLRIKLEPNEVRISPLGNDAVIVKKVNGKILRALVPTHTLGKDHSSVPARRAGKSGNNVILHLPTSNEGRPTWVIPESELESIMVTN